MGTIVTPTSLAQATPTHPSDDARLALVPYCADYNTVNNDFYHPAKGRIV